MNKLAIATTVAALAFGFAASDAAANHRENHQRGGGNDSFPTIFQAPFIDVTTAPDRAASCKDAKSSADGICDGSEGRIASNGAYAVTIQNVAGAAGGYDLCLDINGDGLISDIGGICDNMGESPSNLCTAGLIGQGCETDENCDEFVANASPAGSTLIFPGADGMCTGDVCTAGLTGKDCTGLGDAGCVASGNLIDDDVIVIGESGFRLDAPFFEVFSGGAGTCTGDPVFRSGIVINN